MPPSLQGRGRGRVQRGRGRVLWGWRAAFLLLQKYYDVYGLRTLRQIISRWAPAGDGANHPESYARCVATIAGMGIDDPLPRVEDCPLVWMLVVAGMARVENGSSYTLSMTEVLQGWAMAFGDKLVQSKNGIKG